MELFCTTTILPATNSYCHLGQNCTRFYDTANMNDHYNR